MMPILATFLLSASLLQADPFALFEAGRYEAARLAFEHRLAVRANDPEALYFLGRLSRSGAESKGFFNKLLATHPDHERADDALFELAEADYGGGQGLYVTARRRYRRLLSSYPDSPLAPRAYYRVGLTFLITHMPDSAALAFRAVLDGFPTSDVRPLAHLGLVDTYLQMNRKEAALREAEALLASDPKGIREIVEERIRSLKARRGK